MVVCVRACARAERDGLADMNMWARRAGERGDMSDDELALHVCGWVGGWVLGQVGWLRWEHGFAPEEEDEEEDFEGDGMAIEE